MYMYTSWRNPLAFFSPCQSPLYILLLLPSTYLEPLLAVIGSRPPWSQVTRELNSPFSTPPHSSPFQIPSTLLRFPQHPAPTKTTTRLRLPRSGTVTNVYNQLYPLPRKNERMGRMLTIFCEDDS
jgi:hypothetical protein